jgi:hypothetical protein
MKDVSIIIINYNNASYTVDCVSSVIEKTDVSISYDIIIVDNNSEIDDFKELKTSLPSLDNVFLHRSVINTGFGGGNMSGVQLANSKYFLFLNNDTLLKNDCISILYNYMESNKNVGVSTAQNYDENGKFVISFDHDKGIRKLLFGRSFLEKMFSKTYPKRKKEYSQPVTVNYVNGAFMFFRSDVFAKIGGFDNNIFLYFEEMDICYRMRQEHYTSVLVPDAKVLHFQGVSIEVSKTINKESFLSYIYVIGKNYSYCKYLFIRFYYSITLLFKPKKWYLLPIIFKGPSVTKSLKQKQKIRFLSN